MKTYNTCTTLPDGYRKIYSIDMHSDRKMAFLVNGIAAVIALVMAIGMHFIVPVTSVIDTADDSIGFLIKMAVTAAGLLVYIILHEAVHGIAMKLYGCSRVRFGFKGSYAFAATDDYIARKPYAVIALAPIVLWGVVLAVINALVPYDWFWVVYFIQITNISGAAGDLYVTLRFRNLPSDILVKDAGVSMEVFSAHTA